MKVKFLLALPAALLLSAGISHAGWGWGGGYGWGGPAFGITFAAPIPVYRPVYYAQPAPYYVQQEVRVSRPASTLVRAQYQLANLGYYSGVVDGSFGPLTSRAAAQYQADNGLRVTGRLDRATLKSLGV